MAEINLEVTLRKQTGKSKAKALRRANIIPAVVYGEKINFPISIDKTKFQRLMGSRAAENIIINLKITDEASSTKKSKEKDHPVLIKDIQYDPLKGSVIHVDFNEISLTKEITVKVPLIAKGEPIGVKQDGGVLSHQVWELDIKCLPKDLPEKIEVDVSNLKINDDIRIKDLKLAAGVVALQDLEMVVLSVVPPTKEEVAKPAEAEAVVTEAVKQEPEVIKEKKEKEGETPEAAKEKPKEKEKAKE